jgi:hypothetical protein
LEKLINIIDLHREMLISMIALIINEVIKASKAEHSVGATGSLSTKSTIVGRWRGQHKGQVILYSKRSNEAAKDVH